jgi:hypothetical protein
VFRGVASGTPVAALTIVLALLALVRAIAPDPAGDGPRRVTMSSGDAAGVPFERYCPDRPDPAPIIALVPDGSRASAAPLAHRLASWGELVVVIDALEKDPTSSARDLTSAIDQVAADPSCPAAPRLAIVGIGRGASGVLLAGDHEPDTTTVVLVDPSAGEDTPTNELARTTTHALVASALKWDADALRFFPVTRAWMVGGFDGEKSRRMLVAWILRWNDGATWATSLAPSGETAPTTPAGDDRSLLWWDVSGTVGVGGTGLTGRAIWSAELRPELLFRPSSGVAFGPYAELGTEGTGYAGFGGTLALRLAHERLLDEGFAFHVAPSVGLFERFHDGPGGVDAGLFLGVYGPRRSSHAVPMGFRADVRAPLDGAGPVDYSFAFQADVAGLLARTAGLFVLPSRMR